MANHTIVNLREVDDSAPKHGLSPGIEARYARDLIGTERCAVNYFRLAPDFRTPFGDGHSEQEEVYVIVEGTARLAGEDEVVELATSDAARVSPGAWHSLAGGPEGCTYIAIGAPNNDNKDAEMKPGWWPG